MEAGVAAIIVNLVIDMNQGILKEKNCLLTLLVPLTFFANFFLNINVFYIINFCSFLSFVQAYIKGSKGGFKSD